MSRFECGWMSVCGIAVFAWLAPASAQVADIKNFTMTTNVARQDAAIRALPSLVEASRIARDSARGGLDAARQKLAVFGGRIVDGEFARVEIIGRQHNNSAVAAAVAAVGGTVRYEVPLSVEASVPIAAIESLARTLPATYHIVPLGFGQQVAEFEGQGPTIMNSGAYRDLGYDGTGITIAVIDVGFANLTTSQNTDDAPDDPATADYTGNGLQAPADGSHGRAVLETIFDHAPGADYRLYKVTGQTQVATAVNDAVDDGADIINMSLGYFPDWEDDSSPLVLAVNDAGANGVLVFVSAGNSADLHWQDEFYDEDGDDYLSWDDDDDEVLQCTIPPGASGSFRLSWDRSGGDHDYDLFLYNSDATQLLDTSAQGGENYESVSVLNGSGANLVVQVVARRMSGAGTTLELFVGGSATLDEHNVAASSVLSPSDASHANVLSVGAVEQNSYGSAKYTCCIQASYSSRGPTNSLQQFVPDICAPTSTATSYMTSFIGTSCAAPHASGVAACLWSVNPAATAGQVRALLLDWARAKDWGSSVGTDNTFGVGGVHFPLYADCNLNDYADALDIASGGSEDDNQNGKPDECDLTGFTFDLNAPPLSPHSGLTLLASIVPTAGPTMILPQVGGFRMSVAFNPAQLDVNFVEPAPALLEFLGGAPAVFEYQVLGGFVAINCVFVVDATGAPGALPLELATEMVAIHASAIPGSGPIGGPTMISAGFEETTGLLVPAVQRVRSLTAVGTMTETSPAGVSADVLFPVTQDILHFYQLGGVRVATGDIDGDTFAEYDPTAPELDFAIRWSARSVTATSALSTSLSAAMSFDPALLVATAATPVGATVDAAAEFFSVSLGTDGVAIQIVWSSAATGSYDFSDSPEALADIDFVAAAGALVGDTDGATAVVRFGASSSQPTALNRVQGFGFDETPLFHESVVVLLPTSAPVGLFRRGDFDGNGGVNIGDAISLLGHLFQGQAAPSCFDAADVNDDGLVTIADPIFALTYLFQGGTPPPAPGPTTCGPDATTADLLDCASPGGC